MTVLAGLVDKSTLDAVLRARGTVASVYAGPAPDVANEYQLGWSTRWGPMADALREQGADERTVTAVEREVAARSSSRAARGTGHVAAFAKDGQVLATISAPGATWTDTAACRALAHVTPLVAWAQQRPPYVVAVIDRAGADIEVSPGAGGASVVSTVEGPDDEIEWNDASGLLSQGRAERRAEDSWRHNAGAVAEQVRAALERVRARVLVVSGDVRAVRLLRERLPEWVHRSVTVEQIKGSRSPDGSQRGRADAVVRAIHNAAARDLDQLWGTFGEQRSPGGMAVEGEHATLAALAEGRVGTLMVRPRDADGRTAWFGAGPTDVQPIDQPAPEWTDARLGPLVDVAVRSALLTGAQVRVIPPEAEDGPAEGIAGLCRFR